MFVIDCEQNDTFWDKPASKAGVLILRPLQSHKYKRKRIFFSKRDDKTRNSLLERRAGESPTLPEVSGSWLVMASMCHWRNEIAAHTRMRHRHNVVAAAGMLYPRHTGTLKVLILNKSFLT